MQNLGPAPQGQTGTSTGPRKKKRQSIWENRGKTGKRYAKKRKKSTKLQTLHLFGWSDLKRASSPVKGISPEGQWWQTVLCHFKTPENATLGFHFWKIYSWGACPQTTLKWLCPLPQFKMKVMPLIVTSVLQGHRRFPPSQYSERRPHISLKLIKMDHLGFIFKKFWGGHTR